MHWPIPHVPGRGVVPRTDAAQKLRVERDIAVQQVQAGTIIGAERRTRTGLDRRASGPVKVSVGNAEGKVASLTCVPAGGWIGEARCLSARCASTTWWCCGFGGKAPAGRHVRLAAGYQYSLHRYPLHQLNEWSRSSSARRNTTACWIRWMRGGALPGRAVQPAVSRLKRRTKTT